jgi:transcriptional regulator with XRE-family HTH domain
MRLPSFAATIAKRGRNRQRGKDVAHVGMDRKTIEQIVGERIRARRAELGLTQEELGLALGLSYQQVQKYENGTSRITLDRLLALARRMEVPATAFLAGLPGAAPAEPDLPRPGPSPAWRDLAEGFAGMRDEGVRQAVANLVRAVAEREG